MKQAFDYAASLKNLKQGLIKPNPDNPNKTMWTVEDFDIPSPGYQYQREQWEKFSDYYGKWPVKPHVNPLEEFRGLNVSEIEERITQQSYVQPEEVQVIDPKDLDVSP